MRKKVGPAHNLKYRYPAIAAQWHGRLNGNRRPIEFAPFSQFRAKWQCSQNPKHVWTATIASRTNNGTGCGYCKNKLVDRTNSLATLRPDLARSWHPTRNRNLSPHDVVPGSQKRVWWQCPDNPEHAWTTSIAWRTKGTKCPKCSTSTSLLEVRVFCELRAIFPDALHRHRINAFEADIFLPKRKIAIEVDGHYWHHEKSGHEKKKAGHFKDRGIALFRVRGKGLPSTSTRDVFFGKKENHLPVLHRLGRKLLSHGDLSSLERLRLGAYISSTRFLNTSLFLRLSKRLNMPTSGASLQERFPTISREWHPSRNGHLKPSDVSFGSERKAWWICSKKKEHVWEASVAHRTGKSRSGCLYCAGKLVLPSESLLARFPTVSIEWNRTKNSPLSPLVVSPGSNRKVWWICSKNKSHLWKSSIHSRVSRFKSKTRGCPFCSSQQSSPELSIASKYPKLAREWHPTRNRGLTPWDVTPGSEKKPWWRCVTRKNHPPWRALVYNRAKGARCPACANESRVIRLSSTFRRIRRQA